MPRPEVAGAIGFDLGETLLTYADTPLSWARLYAPALARVAASCHVRPDAAAYACAEAILTRHNTRLHPRTLEIGAERIFEEILTAWAVPVPALARTLPTALEAFFAFFQQRLVAYAESAEILTALRTQGVALGALTDVPYGMPRAFVEADLRHSKLAPLLDVVLTSVDVGERKPAPTGFHALATALNVPTAALWYVGNEEKDMAGAHAAGATAVALDREDRRPRWGQAHTLRDLRGLPSLLRL